MTSHVSPTSPAAGKATILVLGAGWLWQFLEPALKTAEITYVATTTNGREGTIPFKFDLELDGLEEAFKTLPLAEYVLVTFPLKGKGLSRKLVHMYAETHPQDNSTNSDRATAETKFIQLGSTGIWTSPDFVDSHSPIDPGNERGIAEEELISLGGCVLNLAGLYGAQRQPGNWIARVAKTKEQLGEKGALHLIHGMDVAGAVIGVIKTDSQDVDDSGQLFGRRWIVADCVSYDWWSIVWDCNGDSREEDCRDQEDASQHTRREERSKYRRWVMELMQDKGVKALPRPLEALGRRLDAREFWNAVGILPERTLRR
ncbi:hypothetical protein AYL99_04405 [Fonsecaea erecta]|uniref:NmrA-like domain-containing protein n=1 Tax=Fonsecaea erecta TaxID=1367422 RepID=A0A178ZRC5_9EURO|nr:hypothetical protein AYL99_04405 [Fonsecaea erecta]OAP62202.1 hypothetical protein AYL99_04405 [Fonsecaea erecta]